MFLFLVRFLKVDFSKTTQPDKKCFFFEATGCSMFSCIRWYALKWYKQFCIWGISKISKNFHLYFNRATTDVLCEDTLRRIHEADLDHTGDCKVLQQKCLAQYRAENLRVYCQDVTVTCTKCKEERMVILDTVPMYHLSHKTRANICQTLMMPVENSGNRKRTRKSLVPIFTAGDRPVRTQDRSQFC